MPTLTVSLNREVISQVRTDGYDVMSVSVQGTCVDHELAEISMAGTRGVEHGDATYLTWINSVALQGGDLVEVIIQEQGETSHEGKTIAELFPQEEPAIKEMDFTPPVGLFTELRSKKRVRSGFRFELATSRGTTYLGETAEPEHGFGFTLLWNSQRPERANLSLHSYTIDSLEHQQPMRDHVREYVKPFTIIRFIVHA